MALDWTPALLQEAKELWDAWKRAQDEHAAEAYAQTNLNHLHSLIQKSDDAYNRLVNFLYDDANKALRYVLPMGTDEWSKTLADFMRELPGKEKS